MIGSHFEKDDTVENWVVKRGECGFGAHLANDARVNKGNVVEGDVTNVVYRHVVYVLCKMGVDYKKVKVKEEAGTEFATEHG